MNKNLLPEGTPVLSMDDPDFAEKFAEATGIKPGEPVEIITPQFHREPGAPPAHSAPEPFSEIYNRSIAELRQLGCRAWDEPDSEGYVLMLLPGEWYDKIPNGTQLIDINGEPESFVRGVTDDDIRCGCLAFGVRVKP
jgi:hypothetical protein